MAKSWILVAVAACGAAAWGASRCVALQDGAIRVPASSAAAREFAAALFDEKRYDECEALLRALLARRDAEPADRTRLGQVYFARWLSRGTSTTPAEVVEGWGREARRQCKAALELAEADACAHYVLGVLAASYGPDLGPGDAVAPLSRARELAPDDVGARYHLATAWTELGETARARASWDELFALGPEHAGPYWRTIVYRLSRSLLRSRDPADRPLAQQMNELFATLPEPLSNEQEREDQAFGSLGKLRLRAPVSGDRTVVAPARVRFSAPEPLAAEPVGAARAFTVADVDGDRIEELIVADDGGIEVAWLGGARAGERLRFGGAGATQLVVAEFEGDERGTASFLVREPSRVRLYSPCLADRIHDESGQLPPAASKGGTPSALLPVDFDHDGNLDLVAAQGFELRLWRSLGVPRDDEAHQQKKIGSLRFEDVTAGAGLAAPTAEWVVSDDFDGDHDVDLLVGGAESPTLLHSNLRRGRFETRDAAATGLPEFLAIEPLVADLDGDSWPDVLTFGAAPAFLRGDGELRFAAAPAPPGLLRESREGVVLVDADLDGLPEWREGELATDLDLDGDLDLLAIEEGQLVVRRGELEDAPRRALLVLRGRRDNRFALGAVVEVRCGARYQRRFVRHPVQLFGFAGDDEPIVRITWPDGVTQHPLQDPKREDIEPIDAAAEAAIRRVGDSELRLDLARDQRLVVTQKKGPPGSCPFLYSWNGERYEFVTDVLGATPLGLPIDETRFVAPDHDELVRLAPGQCAPIDGEYRFQLTEELRETTYLDRAQLWIVDHPAGVEVHPEERFCFPPFPPTTLHALRRTPLAGARDQAGRDWSGALAAEDDLPAIPFTRLPELYRGLATRHSLELALPAAARDAKRIRLVMTGWLQWGDASVNLAIARSGSLEFLPPALDVPDGRGGWRSCGPPLGFPAGKTKTMVIDVTPWVVRDDLRLRLTSTLELYWDRIDVALDDGDAPLHVTRLEPKSARLWERGFSRPLPREPWQAERYDWNAREPIPRFDQHQGRLTRYGEVLELLGSVDDRYVLFSAGDAIDLRFDASALAPPAEGLARTCLLYLDGWAKDGDANTVHSQTVTPLPFHGMSGYPYRDDERFPDDEAHRAWQLEWNTRPGRKLLPALGEAYDAAAVDEAAAAPAQGG